MAEQHHFPETAPSTGINRRTILKGAALAAVAGVGAKVGFNTMPQAQANTESQTPHQAEAESSHEHDGISNRNFLSALGVLGAFGHVVGKNIKGTPFGPKSAAEVLMATGARNVVMRLGSEADKTAAQHELAELKMGLGIAGLIAGIAEVTAHGEVDPDALFNKVKTIGEGLDAEAQLPVAPELGASTEEWRAYEYAQKMQAVDVRTQTLVLSGLMAPTATIFTAATQANVMNERLAGTMAELRYAQAVLEAKTSNVASNSEVSFVKTAELDEATLREKANAQADKDINGADGAVLLSMLQAANIQGIIGYGGPPNLFYLKNNGPAEWAKASGILGGIMNATAFAAEQQWLAKHLGLEAGVVNARSMAVMPKTALKIAAGIGKSFAQPDAAFRNNKSWATDLDAQLRAIAQNGTFDPEEIAALHTKLDSLPRVPFEYDTDGLVRAFSELTGDTRDNLKFRARETRQTIANIAKTFLGKETAKGDLPEHEHITTEDIDHIVQGKDFAAMLELISHNPDSSNIPRAIIEHYMGANHNNNINQLLDVFEAITHGQDLSQEQQNAMKRVFADTEKADVNTLFHNVENALHRGNAEEVSQAFDALTEDTAQFDPSDTREAAERFEILRTGDKASDPHAGTTRGLDHATKDVIAALSTQLGASGPAATVATKLVELSQGALPKSAQNILILSLVAGLSSFADNIVAYASGEATLLNTNMPKGEQNPQTAADLEKFKNTLTRSALAVATVAGANSNIGSMAALKFNGMVPTYDQATGKNTIQKRQLKLGETIYRPYGAVPTAIAILAGAAAIESARPKPEQTLAQPSRGRRELFGALLRASK